ncbi:DUF2000 domain-containing protein [Hyalangium rubrum]|uniref:DUF2000 domain-containing protein n=1 Tax=Hyalangium rubrum TaxID=3103134 RepID=A0ABU5GZT4_9BACT|nr:DUF2000 domain-containing protein [Hyalangium sp. s54d21]MDY7226556.1 DUF2000 domain-containing protein [Hyalangium sp. s54d21]
MPETFTTKVALIVREDLAIWQKLNVTAFLATGIAAAAPEAIGEPYEDAAGRRYCRLLGQPMLVFSATRAELQSAHRAAVERGLTAAVYVGPMFATGNDEANRAALGAENPEDLDLVGLAVRGDRKQVDKAVKGLALHK